jgi:hypothetical protein
MNNRNRNTENVLIVVDFQNCFITGGSFSGHNTADLDKLKNLYKQTKEIEKLIDNNDTIVFSRDFHPKNHSSIGNRKNSNGKNIVVNYSTTWPKHCTNNNSNCASTVSGNSSSTKGDKIKVGELVRKTLNDLKLNEVNRNPVNISNNLQPILNYNKLNSNIKNSPVIGTNLSYTLFFTKYGKDIYSLITKRDPVGVVDNKNVLKGEPDSQHIKILRNNNQNNNVFLESGGKTMFQLVKGQYCDYESHSAFNYHIKIKEDGYTNNTNSIRKFKSDQIITKDTSVDKLFKYSTGLLESILISDEEISKYNITVCGFVGDVCVLQTVVQGLIMIGLLSESSSENIFKNISFTYSLCGTRFTGIPSLEFGESKTPSEDDILEMLCDRLNETNKLYKQSPTNTNTGKKEKYLTNNNFLRFMNFNVTGYEGQPIGRIYYDGEKITSKSVNNTSNV